MKHIIALLAIAISVQGWAQRGKDGASSISASAIVNAYTAVTADVSAGSTAITVADNSLSTNFGGVLLPGDLIMIYQAQGATIAGVPNGNLGNPNGPTWGEVTNYGNSGKYEFAEVVGTTGTTGITVSCALQNDYTASGHAQVIRVPRYSSLTVNGSGTIIPSPWNGSTGGVVAVESLGDVIVNGAISADGSGFRGGSLVGDNVSTFSPDWVINGSIPDAGAEKGESIAGYQADYDTNNGGRIGRACPANGGGGGNAHNGGGGGGANVNNPGITWSGFGVVDPAYNTAWSLEAGWLPNHNRSGGGRGGYTFSSSNCDATVQGPNDACWGGDFRRPYGGQGGRTLDYSTGSIYFGGGGGAGDQNDGDGGEGGAGGGIVFIMGYGDVTGTGAITANGADGEDTDPSNPPFGSHAGADGAGGGGGGGVVICNVDGSVANTVNINVNGGDGGNQVMAAGAFGSVTEAEGPGAGGGGGYIGISAGAPTRTSTGGTNGTTNSPHLTEFPPNGATSGGAGAPNNSIDNYYPVVTDAVACSGGAVILTASIGGTAPAGTTIGWYDAEFGGNLLGTGTTFNTGALGGTTTYYVGLCPGHYRVPVTVTISPAIVIDENSMVIADETCAGNDGSITGITVSGGTTPYAYDWNGSASTGTDLTNISGGNYTLTVTDAAGCTATSGPHTVGTGAGPTVDVSNISITDATCGNSNGAISGITHSGGAAPISYSWNGGTYTTLDISNVPGGSYTLTVTDNLGCSTTVGPFTVNDAPGPNIDDSNINVVNETCTNSNGEISGINVTGGTTPYTFSWNGGTFNTLGISGLPAGNYTLLVTDGNGCTATSGPYAITNAAGPVIDASNVSIADENCGSADGSITGITFTGGTSPFNFDWSGTSTAGTDFTNISAGSYTLTITDANGCTATSGPHTVGSIGGPTVDIANMTVSDETCTIANGAISGITVTGGATPYTFSWNGGAFNTLDISGLSAGNYTLLVTDGNGCTGTVGPVVVSDQASPTLDLSNMNVADETCTNANGAISGIVVNGGTSPFSYDWNAGAFNTPDIINLSAGNYTLIVTDGNGCTVAAGPVTINDQAGPTVDDSNVVIVDEACGQTDGSITGITVSGGTSPLLFEWDAIPTLGIDTVNIGAGTYTLNVTDANGCGAVSGPHVVNNVPAPTIDVTNMVLTDETCTAGNGSITGIVVTGGTAPLTIDWNSGAFNTLDISSLSAGSYTLVVTDARGCSSTVGPFNLTNAPSPTLDASNISITDETCTASNGSITGITVSGGTSPLTYDWNNGAYATLDITNIPAGTYDLTVTDANGCTVTSGPHLVTDAAGPVLDTTNYVIVDEICGQGNGAITGITVSGGTSPLIYQWSSGFTPSPDNVGIAAGVYGLLVADANGCTAYTGPYLVNSAGGPVVDDTNIVITDESCAGNDGSITGIVVTGGAGGYTYAWNTVGAPSQDLQNAQAGSYVLSVTDANGCVTTVGPYTIGTIVPDAFTAIINNDTTVCMGDSLFLSGTVTGGSGNVTLQWVNSAGNLSTVVVSGGSTAQTFQFWYTPSGTDTLCFIASDLCGTAPDTSCFIVTVSPLPTVSFTTDVTQGCDPLTVTFVCTGSNYTSGVWDFGDGNTSTNLDTVVYTYLNPGVYDVTQTLTSADGCVASATNTGMITVYETPVASFTCSPDPVDADNPTVDFTDASSGPVSGWDWDFAGAGYSTNQDPVFTFAGAGSYPVTLAVVTADGCVDTFTKVVEVAEVFDAIVIPNVFSPNNDGRNDVWVVQNMPDGNHQLQIYNRWGQLLYSTDNYANNWDGYTQSGEPVPEGTYFYILRLEDGEPVEGHLTIVR